MSIENQTEKDKEVVLNDESPPEKEVEETQEKEITTQEESLKKEKPPRVKWSKKKKIKFWITISLVVVGLFLLFGLPAIIGGGSAVKSVWDFISDQILGMKWLNAVIGLAVGGIFGNEFASGHWGSAIQFFIYDTIKIFILLCLLIFVISYIQSFFPPTRTKRILGKFKGIGANIVGALLGTVTPFCSCSSIPIFMGFTKAGLSSGVTFSFLISSPLVDLGAFILLASSFGFPIAIAYVVIGIVLAVIGGTIIEKTKIGDQVQDFIKQNNSSVDIEDPTLTRKDRLIYAKDQVFDTIKKVWLYILVGVLIGAAIHNFIPEEWIQSVLGNDKWYSVLLASIVGVPIYADIFGTIPIAEALFAKGAGLGTILSFMMSVTTLSVPSLVMLSKAVKPKLLFWFIAIVVIGIILIGYLFNAFGFIFI